MSSLPNRQDLISDSSLNSNIIELPPSIDMEDLKTMALRASQVAILQLIKSLQTSQSDAVKNRAAETLLQIAFGKDKESLRSNEDTRDAVQEIADLIAQSRKA